MTRSPGDSGVGSAYRNVRAIVLGASGFLGRWVARALTDAGADVTLVGRSIEAVSAIMEPWAITGRAVATDLRDTAALEALLRTEAPDVVFNLAGYGVDRAETDEGIAHAMNRDLPVELARILAGLRGPARWQGLRLVHAGSALEYGAVHGMVVETGSVAPHTLYGRSKLAGTQALAQAAQASGLRAVTARVFTVFGSGEHRGRLWPTLLEASRTGADVALSTGTQRRDFAYAEDVAEGLLRIGISSAGEGERVNLATGRLRSVREFARTAAMVLGIPTERIRFGSEPVRLDEMAIDGVEIGRLRELTSWAPSSDLERGMTRAHAFETGLHALPDAAEPGKRNE